MNTPQIVIDTNAFISALLSQRGAAYRLLMLIDSGLFEVNLSVPLIIEYEAVSKRILNQTKLTGQELTDILDYLCTVANKRQIFFLWRPFLPDPGDDMVLELAVSAGCQYIVTFNQEHFVGCEQFGIQVVTPREFFEQMGQQL
ncbi:MAG: putative toxin-antitoxin system toxin component, PIN family [Candidatus Poribacteria bacterium]|nr:putative toxin-antitoxin system toxin component, PIN family [Candidatus Poribacteria bacterium]